VGMVEDDVASLRVQRNQVGTCSGSHSYRGWWRMTWLALECREIRLGLVVGLTHIGFIDHISMSSIDFLWLIACISHHKIPADDFRMIHSQQNNMLSYIMSLQTNIAI
jgi:hypothetical protein